MDLINSSNSLKCVIEIIRSYRSQFNQIIIKAKALVDELGVNSETKEIQTRCKTRVFL